MLQEPDWTLKYDELFYGAARRFLKTDKKILIVGMDEYNDMKELFLMEEPDENFFIEAYELDKYKAAAIFKRNNNDVDLNHPRKSLEYIDSFNTIENIWKD